MLKNQIIVSFLFLSVAFSQTIDVAKSKVGFSAKAFFISKVSGEFRKWSGSVRFNEKGKLTHLRGEIKVASIDTGIKKRDDHLRHEDFFDEPNYPVIRYKLIDYSGDAKGGKLKGEITMRAVTQIITLQTSISTMEGGDKKLLLWGTVLRKDFGIGEGFKSSSVSKEIKIDVVLIIRK